MPSKSGQATVMDPEGPTGKLCNWVENLTLDQIPEEIKTRSKYLMLDGIACALVGAHLPWSATAAEATFEIESPGKCSVIGWDKAALINSTFIQGFELDDWHSDAPLHSNSLLIPAMLAATEQSAGESNPNAKSINGSDFLLALIAGYETGPRVGMGLYGAEFISRGWHSGAVFGGAPTAVSVSKLLGLPAAQIEDALGTACTQAGGLMAAQYESDAKRMQHGFASRNGLLAAFLARRGYIGIKMVMERPYGGFLACFGQGSGRTPPFRAEEICKDLGSDWTTDRIRVKPYSSMATTHGGVDCAKKMQKEHAGNLKNLSDVQSILLEMGSVQFHHGGFEVQRPLSATGAQMSAAYVLATQLVDGAVAPAQFKHSMLDRDGVWELVEKTKCVQNDALGSKWAQKLTVGFKDGKQLVSEVQSVLGIDPPMSNEDIVEKFYRITKGAVDEGRARKIEEMVLGLDGLEDITKLIDLLAGMTENPIA